MNASDVTFFVLATVAGLGCIGVLCLVVYTLRISSRKNGQPSLWQSLKRVRTRCPVCGLRFFALSRYCAHCGARLKDQQASVS